MKKEYLIKKWLDNELSPKELLEFQQLEEYDSYVKMSEKAHLFKAPEFNVSEAYKKIEPIVSQKRATKSLIQRLKPVMQIAAVFIVGMILYSIIFSNKTIEIQTMASQKVEVTLPDNSIAQLNSLSEIKYNKGSWNKKREVELNGEAYFKVAKGSQFNVQTSSGIVSVLGTQFNVKNRQDYFEVTCFEGKVRVAYSEDVIILTAGKTVRVMNGKFINDNTTLAHPSWTDNYSTFKSVPFSEVIAEFERQYNVKINIDKDTNVLFTGTFTHTNKEQGLQSITIPLNLKYTIKNDTIRLK